MKSKKKRLEAITELALDALEVDGEHHKQWYIEKILKLCGVDVNVLRKTFRTYGNEGIAP